MKWEYKVVELWVEREAELNKLGSEGWELVHIDAELNAYFKRLDREANKAEYERFWREEVGCAPPF